MHGGAALSLIGIKKRSSIARLVGGRAMDGRKMPADLAADQADPADFLSAPRGTNDDLDIAPEPEQDSDEPVGREPAQLAIEQQRNLGARLTRLVGDFHLRHVALLDDALNFREQLFLPDEGVANPRL